MEEIEFDNSNDNSSEVDDEFLSNINSILSVKTNYDRKEYNYSWIDIIEDVLPYLDNILRNPKRFIINEEEIVKVELARRVTVESVIHLTQHTNLIQDIDKKNGDVRPSKILNINKDESLDTYENRFVYTLINNLGIFFRDRSSNIANESSCFDRKRFGYEANTRIGSEDIKVSLNLESINKTTKAPKTETGMSVSERLAAIKMQLDSFTSSELMQTLNKLHVPPVRSPIRKTNVILKNPNFQKAERLWNYIQSYNQDDCVNEKEDNEYLDMGELRKQYDQSFLYAYIANRSLTGKSKKLTERGGISLVVDCLIRNILDYDMDIDEKVINEIFSKRFKKAKNDVENRCDKISNILINKFDKTNEQFIKSGMLLK